MYQNCSFKPEFTVKNLKGNLRINLLKKDKNIFNKTLREKNKLLQEANEPFDNKTGQELFSPLINDNKNNNLSKRKDVFAHFYS